MTADASQGARPVITLQARGLSGTPRAWRVQVLREDHANWYGRPQGHALWPVVQFPKSEWWCPEASRSGARQRARRAPRAQAERSTP